MAPDSTSASDRARGWRVGHQGRDRMYYEELRDGTWERLDIDGEMLMGRAHHVIYFAGPTQWQRYPAWARDRRDEIIVRITSEFREPDYEHDGLQPGSAAPTASTPASLPSPIGPSKRRPGAPTGIKALVVAVVLLFALAAAMGWLVTSGIRRDETTLPMKRATLRRTVARAQEPAMYWVSIGVYVAIGTGALALAVVGVRAGVRLQQEDGPR